MTDICCSWTSSGSCRWTPATGTSSTPGVPAPWATICAGRSGGGSGGATTSRRMASPTSVCPSTTVPVVPSGLPCLTGTPASMLTSLSAVSRTENSLDATARPLLKVADIRRESFLLYCQYVIFKHIVTKHSWLLISYQQANKEHKLGGLILITRAISQWCRIIADYF